MPCVTLIAPPKLSQTPVPRSLLDPLPLIEPYCVEILNDAYTVAPTLNCARRPPGRLPVACPSSMRSEPDSLTRCSRALSLTLRARATCAMRLAAGAGRAVCVSTTSAAVQATSAKHARRIARRSVPLSAISLAFHVLGRNSLAEGAGLAELYTRKFVDALLRSVRNGFSGWMEWMRMLQACTSQFVADAYITSVVPVRSVCSHSVA